jgi:hypothetical protein
MHDPNNQFQVGWDSGYAYPPQIKPIFYQQAWELASHLKESQALVDTPFPCPSVPPRGRRQSVGVVC